MLTSRKKVLVIAYIFPPLARAGVHRTVRFVRYLPELGWDLTVLTVAEPYYPPNSPIDRELLKKIPATVKVAATPVFRGVENLFRIKKALRGKHKPAAISQHEITKKAAATEAAQIADNHPAATKPRGLVQRGKDLITDLTSIPDKDVNWLPHAVKHALALHRREKFDLIYSTAPPFTDHLVAQFIKQRTGLPWVADFRDPWARAPWKAEILGSSLRGKAAAKLEHQFVRHADRVILNTDWIHREFTQHYGANLSRKFTVITNGFDPQDFTDPVMPPARNAKMIITHTGALYRKRSPEQFFAACERLLAQGKIAPHELEIRFVGGIAPELYRTFECSAALRQTIQVIPQVSHREALGYQLQSDVLFILQPGTSVSVPGKIFEYIGMRKRILALTPAGATADVVRDHQLGPVVDPEDLPGIEAALNQLVDEYRRGGIASPSVNGAFKKYDGVELTRQLHHEFLLSLEHGGRG
ncbi:glycosyltransferase [candidate division KSB1 bacterium]|nr:glycosyltransferase [candidate division KSB1 bacterium]